MLLGVSDKSCHSSAIGQSLMFLRLGLKFRVCAGRPLMRFGPSAKAHRSLFYTAFGCFACELNVPGGENGVIRKDVPLDAISSP